MGRKSILAVLSPDESLLVWTASGLQMISNERWVSSRPGQGYLYLYFQERCIFKAMNLFSSFQFDEDGWPWWNDIATEDTAYTIEGYIQQRVVFILSHTCPLYRMLLKWYCSFLIVIRVKFYKHGIVSPGNCRVSMVDLRSGINRP